MRRRWCWSPGVDLLQFGGRAITLAGASPNRRADLDGGRFDDVLFQASNNGQVILADMEAGVLTSDFRLHGLADVDTMTVSWT